MRKTRFFAIILSAVLVFSTFIGCGNSSTGGSSQIPTVEANTIGTKLLAQFYDEITNTSDINTVAEKLTENEVFSDLAMGTMEVSEGYLNGFDDEISGFSSGVMFSPMVGTIPCVGYIFVTDDTAALVDTLKTHAMLNWNICTVADEMVVEAYDNYVFFVMAPTSF